MHIYDVKNPQGLFCQSKADVKYKQHLVLLRTFAPKISHVQIFLKLCLQLENDKIMLKT